MKCPRCQVNFFPVVDHKPQQYDETFHYPFSGRCPKCKQWFEWEEIYTLNEVTAPICITDEEDE